MTCLGRNRYVGTHGRNLQATTRFDSASSAAFPAPP